MPLRVDDIVVTEKNILLLSGGHQFIADIEKNTDALDDGNFTRDRNPWNFYSSDGVLYHNLFDTESFDVRTQTLTGSNRHSPNNSRSHEPIFMPHDNGYVGGCQFYGNAYTITNFTNSTISSYVESGFDESYSTYCSDHGTIRYNALSSYENPSEYYISPNILFEPINGVQFITEYPLNGYYTDFGDNETDGKPTLFGDSVIAKYYLDQNYSVSSYDIDSEESRFMQLRTYYDIGSTGNSIYMVFRNNLNGTAIITDEGKINEPSNNATPNVGHFPIAKVGYMSNIVILSNDSRYTYYSSDPYSDMFEYTTMTDVATNLLAIKQPHDHSFILYLQRKTVGNTEYINFTYIPTIGLERSSYYFQLEEKWADLSIVELSHCVVIGTKKNGILTVWSRDYLYGGVDTLVNFNPFQYACSGIPSFETLSSKINGNTYQSIKLFYNEKDILAATAVVNNNLNKRVAFFSSNFDTDERHYEIGQFFMPAGNPLYEIEVLSSETPVYQEVLSSVPCSTKNDSTEEISWNYKLQKVQVVTDTKTTTSDPFQVSANYVSDCDILFDYSSTEVENELSIGSYAFVQFEKYGLSKCHVDDIYSDDKMVKFSSTGPINRYDSTTDGKTCIDAVFSVISYSNDTKKPILDVIDYVSSDYSTYFVSGKPALKSTFRSSDGKITNSFSCFPLTEREIIKEPVFSSVKSVSAETTPITGFNFALGYPIENSMGISVKTYSTDGANHDASISLVKWNISSGEYATQQQENLQSLSGLHLQYNAICTDVYINGTVLSSVDEDTGVEMPQYSSTIYEYPHPCYGELRTAGTSLPIFDGPFSSDMTTSDVFFVNGYFVVKNYSVEVSAGHTEEWWEKEYGKNVVESGKHQQFSTGHYPHGGYVVTNFFADGGNNESDIPYLYDSELVFSSKEETKTKVDSERFYDYNYLWHIKPSKPIEFYPASIEGKTWTPYYPSKYVDFIKYHNGYYYISLRSKKEHDENTVGYDIIETDTLFEEKECKRLENGLIVTGIKFFDSHVAVEYEKKNGNKFIKWFESGKSFYKVLPVCYKNDSSTTDSPVKHSEVKHAELSTKADYSSEVVASYDNVEVMNSLNRFTPVVNHKSNLFSIRIDDLGFEESEYLTKYQKKVLRTYFRNSITELVNSVKPANTQLFDVYLD